MVAAAWFAAAAPAGAQYELSARVDHQHWIQYEPIAVTLRITNTTPYPLPVGGEGGAVLSFRVERGPNRPVDGDPSALNVTPVLVPPRGQVSFPVSLSPAYDFRKTGPYAFYAVLDYQGQRSRSGRSTVNVVPGLVVHQQRVVGRSGSRTVSLRTLERNQAQHLFCRVEDEQAQICYGVHDLGRVLHHDPKTILVDAEDRIHILHQASPDRYAHSIIRFNGTPISLDLIGRANPAPELRYTDEGDVEVVGGLAESGETPVDRPQITPFNPFPAGVPNRLDRELPDRPRR